MLARLGGRWVVQTDAGLRDALTGIRLERPDDVVQTHTHEPEPAREHADIPFKQEELRAWLTITGSLRHPNPKTAPFGQVIRRITETLLDEAVLEWGWDEPVTLAWDDIAVAEDLRDRFGGASMIFAAGADEQGRRLVASTDISQTDAGAEEVFSVTVDVGPGNPEGNGADFALGPAALEAITDAATPLIAFATATIGHPDLHRWPWLTLPTVPMAILIGAPGVSRFGIRSNPIPFEERFVASYIGARRRESLLVELGEVPSPANAIELRDLIAALGPDAAMIGMPEDLVTSIFGKNPRAEIEKQHAQILAEYQSGEPDKSEDEPNADEDLRDGSSYPDARNTNQSHEERDAGGLQETVLDPIDSETGDSDANSSHDEEQNNAV